MSEVKEEYVLIEQRRTDPWEGTSILGVFSSEARAKQAARVSNSAKAARSNVQTSGWDIPWQEDREFTNDPGEREVHPTAIICVDGHPSGHDCGACLVKWTIIPVVVDDIIDL